MSTACSLVMPAVAVAAGGLTPGVASLVSAAKVAVAKVVASTKATVPSRDVRAIMEQYLIN
ncbi:MAG: hypothetical protein R3F36_00065 [Candidatus Competibacteraceae bacterium]